MSWVPATFGRFLRQAEGPLGNVVPSFLNLACSTEIQLLVLCEGRPRGYRCAYQYVRDMWINI